MTSTNKDIKAAWAIAHWQGGVYLDTVSATRREAIEVFRLSYSPDKNWQPCSVGEPNKAIKVTVKGGWRKP